VRKKIEDSNLRYKTTAGQHRRKVIFKVEDKVWVVLTKKRFPIGVIKLRDRKEGLLSLLSCGHQLLIEFSRWILLERGASL